MYAHVVILICLRLFQPAKRYPGDTHIKHIHRDLRLYVMKELSQYKASGITSLTREIESLREKKEADELSIDWMNCVPHIGVL